MLDCLAVGAGGFIGSVGRYLIGKIPMKHSSQFPMNTFLINIIGAFIIGCLAAAIEKNSSINPRLMLFLRSVSAEALRLFRPFRWKRVN